VITFGVLLSWISSTPEHSGSFDSLEVLLSGKMLSGPQVPQTLDGFLQGLRHLDPSSIIALGLLFLIALPILRVGMTVVLFILEKDWLYSAITLFVFLVLMTGILFGRSI
jgi:uncharacterized membrane protein